jgi:hypothetical protein
MTGNIGTMVAAEAETQVDSHPVSSQRVDNHQPDWDMAIWANQRNIGAVLTRYMHLPQTTSTPISCARDAPNTAVSPNTSYARTSNKSQASIPIS